MEGSNIAVRDKWGKLSLTQFSKGENTQTKALEQSL